MAAGLLVIPLVLGLVGITALSVSMLELTGTMHVFLTLVNAMKDMTEEQVSFAMDSTLEIVSWFGVLAIAAAALVIPLGIGMVGIGMLSSSIMKITRTMTKFVELLKQINEVEANGGVKAAINLITEQLVPGIVSIVNGMSEIGLLASLKVGLISSNLEPLFNMLGKFVDVIQKMGSMQIVDHFDENGKPFYKVMKNEDFSAAAETLIGAFKSFLTTLSSLVEGDVITNAAKVIDQLVGTTRTGGSWFGRVFSSKPPEDRPNFKALFEVLSSFVDIITKFASGNIEIEWDENGKCTKRVPIMKVAPEAAKSLAEAFSTFLSTLEKELKSVMTIWGFPIIRQLGNQGEGLGLVMQSLVSFVDALVKFQTS